MKKDKKTAHIDTRYTIFIQVGFRNDLNEAVKTTIVYVGIF